MESKFSIDLLSILRMKMYVVVVNTVLLSNRYCVVFDPLDGSSNIDCGVSIGTVCYSLSPKFFQKVSDVKVL